MSAFFSFQLVTLSLHLADFHSSALVFIMHLYLYLIAHMLAWIFADPLPQNSNPDDPIFNIDDPILSQDFFGTNSGADQPSITLNEFGDVHQNDLSASIPQVIPPKQLFDSDSDSDFGSDSATNFYLAGNPTVPPPNTYNPDKIRVCCIPDSMNDQKIACNESKSCRLFPHLFEENRRQKQSLQYQTNQ